MSIDYSFELAVGFKVNGSEIEKLFGRSSKPRTMLEPRWDPKTGRPAAPEVIVLEPADFTLEFEGDEYDSLAGLVEALCRKIKADFVEVGSYMSDTTNFFIGPKLKRGQNDDVDCNITVGGGVSYRDLVACQESLRAIGARLEALGLQIRGPEVAIGCLVS